MFITKLDLDISIMQAGKCSLFERCGRIHVVNGLYSVKVNSVVLHCGQDVLSPWPLIMGAHAPSGTCGV